MVPLPVEIEAFPRFGLRLVGALDAAEPDLHEREGVCRWQGPKLRFVRRLVASVGRSRRGDEAVFQIDSRFHPKSVKVGDLPGEQP